MTPKWGYVSMMEAHEQSITEYLSQHTIPLLAPGTILHQRYEVERVIGIGGVGHVYLVRDLRSKDAVKWDALKEIILPSADTLDQQTRLSNFGIAVNRLSSLNHPFIPKINEWFSDVNRAYLVLEYVEGLTLEDILFGTNGFLDEQQVSGWALQLCSVLTYLHTQQPPIIFNDLAPSNVMLTPNDEVRLIDFGIAKSLLPKPRMIGCQGYWPPEQYKDKVDSRSDIYALGVMLHQLLTRSDPRLESPFTFHERLPTLLNPNVSPEMEAIIMKCVSYESDQRWQSAQELRDTLKHTLKQSLPNAPWLLLTLQ